MRRQLMTWGLIICPTMLIAAVWLPFALAQGGVAVAGEAGPGASITDVIGLDSSALVLLVLLAISEGLAMTPALQGNGILHAVILALRWATTKGAAPVVPGQPTRRRSTR